ncbi:unnamed protein product [Chrysoparadoxa australica]
MGHEANWLLSIPNEGNNAEQRFRELRLKVGSAAEIFRVELPGSLLIGTLDSLISLSDDLEKADGQLEQVVKKIEKQYLEVAGHGAEPLRVGSVTPSRYLESFEWDYARYAVRQSLPSLAGQMQSSVGKIDEELRAMTSSFTENMQMEQALTRKKGGNLMSTDLNEVLTEEVVRKLQIVDTEHLKTYWVAMAKSSEDAWLKKHPTIGADIAAMGSPDWSDPAAATKLGTDDGQYGPEFSDRAAFKGSPVVPGSTVKVMEDSESCLYTVVILKGQYQAGFYDGEEFQQGMHVDYTEAFKRAAKEQRFTVREFVFDPEKAGENERKAEQLKSDIDQQRSGLVRWCRAHYGAALVTWIHVKLIRSSLRPCRSTLPLSIANTLHLSSCCIRSFAESVLRYGLPADFLTVIARPAKGKEATLRKAVEEMCPAQADADDQDDEDEGRDEYLPFVVSKFVLV